MTNFKTILNNSKVRSFGKTHNSHLLTNLDSIVEQVLQNTYQYLSQFRFDAEYTQKLETAFGNDFDREVANQLFNAFAEATALVSESAGFLFVYQIRPGSLCLTGVAEGEG